MNNYIEPFVGGGSVFLNLLVNKEITIKGKVIVNDSNKHLINLYNCIKNDVKRLIRNLEVIEKNYNDAPMVKLKPREKITIDLSKPIEPMVEKGKIYVYYYYREKYNKEKLDEYLEASIFLFLNKTGFRGLYREGKNGFNVPFGNYKNPSIYTKKQLLNINKLFNERKIEFYNDDFSKMINLINENDFVYIDPPYVPINEKSFVKYNNSGFDEKQHNNLVLFCKKLNDKKIKFVQSNSKCEFVKEKYKEFNLCEINCKRRINSKKPQSMELEYIIWN
jgi:DNA adenine methylase